jgi:hypothetical protein
MIGKVHGSAPAVRNRRYQAIADQSGKESSEGSPSALVPGVVLWSHASFTVLQPWER